MLKQYLLCYINYLQDNWESWFYLAVYPTNNQASETSGTIHRLEAGHHWDVGQSGIMRLFHDIEPNIQPNRLRFLDGIVYIYITLLKKVRKGQGALLLD